MNEDIVISARGIGKSYRIYDNPKDRLKEALWRGRRTWHRLFWALDDVSFELKRGETLGIIGVNGSGKSTLLQIIAGTLQPTKGRVEIRGRITALLELGSGFNPEFTGHENIYLNGSIIGLSRKEIDARYDEIVSFADIGDFLDQPIKTYSTGMVVRLAFAVQVLFDPDILIVDEALAVGDVAFQFKCVNRMRRLQEEGVAVILVTHDVDTVRSLCRNVIWLHEGRVKEAGPPLGVSSRYVKFLLGDKAAEKEVGGAKRGEDSAACIEEPNAGPPETAASATRILSRLDTRTDLVRWGSGEVVIEGVAIDNGEPGCEPVFEYGDTLHVEVQLRAVKDMPNSDIGFGFAFRNKKGLDIITYTTYEAGFRFPQLRAGQTVRMAFELENILAAGEYALILAAEKVERSQERKYMDFIENGVIIQVLSDTRIFSAVLPEVKQELFELSPDSQGDMG